MSLQYHQTLASSGWSQVVATGLPATWSEGDMQGVRGAISTQVCHSSQATGDTHLALLLLDSLRLYSQAAQGGWEVKA